MSGIVDPLVSRRGFLSLAGTAALAAVGAWLVGCSSGGSETNDSSDSAAASSSTPNDASPEAPQGAGTISPQNALIAVFSWSGNTLAMAQRLQELAPGADFFRIEVVDPYPEDYEETADRARDEQDREFLPEITATVDNWNAYDTVFLGYPIWWYELPQPVKSFIDQYDWSGKTIVPFNSHEGSGDGGTPDDIAELCPGATIAQNLAIRGGEVADSLDDVDAWYNELVGA